MRDKFHVLIIGGGVAGPALALFLKKAGISSAVYEAYAPGGELGGGLGLAPNGMNVLAVLGLANTLKRRASPARENRIYDERGHRFATYDTGGTEFGEPNISCMRADLHAVVAEECRRQNITIAYRKRLSRLECRDESVVAHFEDGSSAHGDILVGADGIHSRTRREILPGGRSLNLSASWVSEGRYPAMMCRRCRKPTQKISTLCSDPKAFLAIAAGVPAKSCGGQICHANDLTVQRSSGRCHHRL